ncbi:extracellular protein [Lactiplantibacillus plantarum]|nr:extracellular protein [Lactiplantibacillus plantarum]
MKKINKLMILGMFVFGVTGATMINPEMTTAAHASANITIDGQDERLERCDVNGGL